MHQDGGGTCGGKGKKERLKLKYFDRFVVVMKSRMACT